MNNIRVFLIEDEVIISNALKASFRCSHDHVRITKSFLTVDEAIDAKNENDDFDIVLLDLWIRRTDPITNIKKLKKTFPEKPIILFTSEESDEWKIITWKLGVHAYIIKTQEVCDLKNVIKQLYYDKNKRIFPNHSLSQNDNLKTSQSIRYKFLILTPFQKDIIKYLKNGKCLKEIALETGRSISYVNRCQRKLRIIFSAQNNTELIRIISESEISD